MRTLKKWQRALLAAVKGLSLAKTGRSFSHSQAVRRRTMLCLVASKLSNKNAGITITCGITDLRQYLSKFAPSSPLTSVN